jgi:hypothetical protein
MLQIAQLHESILEALERGETKRTAHLLREHSLGFAAQLEALQESASQHPDRGGPKVYRGEGFGASSDGRSSLKGHAGRADRVKQIGDSKPRARR